MSKLRRWVWRLVAILVGVLTLLVIALDWLLELPPYTFDQAQQRAYGRFLVMADIYGLAPSDFGPPRVQERGDEWLFLWPYLKGEGVITVIVRRNHEVFDGGDERLSKERRRD